MKVAKSEGRERGGKGPFWVERRCAEACGKRRSDIFEEPKGESRPNR